MHASLLTQCCAPAYLSACLLPVSQSASVQFQSASLPVCQSASLPVSLQVCQYIRKSVSQSASLPVNPQVCQSLQVSTNDQSAWLCQSVILRCVQTNVHTCTVARVRVCAFTCVRARVCVCVCWPSGLFGVCTCMNSTDLKYVRRWQQYEASSTAKPLVLPLILYIVHIKSFATRAKARPGAENS